jgi:hypothetical protein
MTKYNYRGMNVRVETYIWKDIYFHINVNEYAQNFKICGYTGNYASYFKVWYILLSSAL